MQIVLIGFAAVMLIVLLKLRKQNQSGAVKPQAKGAQPKKKAAVSKKAADSGKKHRKNAPPPEAETTTEPATNSVAEELHELAPVQPVKVSVQEVDPLTEYKVYKEFGYLAKAAESLKSYLDSRPTADPEMLMELAELYLETEQYETLVDFIHTHQHQLSREQIGQLLTAGLEADANNLELRVLAEELLNWDVEAVNQQVLHLDVQNEATSIEALQDASSESELDTGLQDASVSPERAAVLKQSNKLVSGHGTLRQVLPEELEAVSSMLPADNALKLMRSMVAYDDFRYSVDKALPKLKNPASALIDALGLDLQYKNSDAFAHHLWELYVVLGKNGQGIKDKMLAAGYRIGNHEVLNRLVLANTERDVEEIGKEFGYRRQENNLAAKQFPLVSDEVGASLGKSLGRDVSSILQEADAYLMYGQLNEAMQTLEQGIQAHKDEPQLYVNLFELYERAEDWARLDEFSKRLRADAGNLPDEVILLMSKLVRKLKNNNIGMVA